MSKLIQSDKKIKYIYIYLKENLKTVFFTDDMIIYRENLKTSTKKKSPGTNKQL